MKLSIYLVMAGFLTLCACNTEPTRAAKAAGALNTSTPGKYKAGDFDDDIIFDSGHPGRQSTQDGHGHDHDHDDGHSHDEAAEDSATTSTE